ARRGPPRAGDHGPRRLPRGPAAARPRGPVRRARPRRRRARRARRRPGDDARPPVPVLADRELRPGEDRRLHLVAAGDLGAARRCARAAPAHGGHRAQPRAAALPLAGARLARVDGVGHRARGAPAERADGVRGSPAAYTGPPVSTAPDRVAESEAPAEPGTPEPEPPPRLRWHERIGREAVIWTFAVVAIAGAFVGVRSREK